MHLVAGQSRELGATDGVPLRGGELLDLGCGDGANLGAGECLDQGRAQAFDRRQHGNRCRTQRRGFAGAERGDLFAGQPTDLGCRQRGKLAIAQRDELAGRELQNLLCAQRGKRRGVERVDRRQRGDLVAGNRDGVIRRDRADLSGRIRTELGRRKWHQMTRRASVFGSRSKVCVYRLDILARSTLPEPTLH